MTGEGERRRGYQHLSLLPEVDQFRLSALKLRRCYLGIRPAVPSAQEERGRALEALRSLQGFLKDDSDPARRFIEGLQEAAGFSYADRLYTLNADVGQVWEFELFEAPRWGVSERELRYIRKRSKKDFSPKRVARLERRHRLPAHPYRGSLADFLVNMNTEAVFATSDRPFLTRKEKQNRMRLARADHGGLTAAILAVMNASQQGPQTFQLSYSLAVGSHFMGCSKRRM